MKNNPSNDRLPMLLSAAIFPGLGQLIQRRWLAGTCFALMFGTAMVVLFYNVLTPLFHDYAIIIEWGSNNMNGDLEPVNWGGILIPLAISIVTYIINLVDVVVVQQRRTACELRARGIRSSG